MTALPEMPAGQRLGLAWFDQKDFPAWLAMDANFQPSYDRWLERMEMVIAQYEARGNVVVKVPMDPATFEAWRAATGHGVGTQARAAYVAMQMMLRRLN